MLRNAEENGSLLLYLLTFLVECTERNATGFLSLEPEDFTADEAGSVHRSGMTMERMGKPTCTVVRRTPVVKSHRRMVPSKDEVQTWVTTVAACTTTALVTGAV
jgi:hypothetical protein